MLKEGLEGGGNPPTLEAKLYAIDKFFASHDNIYGSTWDYNFICSVHEIVFRDHRKLSAKQQAVVHRIYDYHESEGHLLKKEHWYETYLRPIHQTSNPDTTKK